MRTVAVIRADLITAHRAGDWESAKRLSQEKIKATRRRYCMDCDNRTGSGSRARCFMCSMRHRYYCRCLPWTKPVWPDFQPEFMTIRDIAQALAFAVAH